MAALAAGCGHGAAPGVPEELSSGWTPQYSHLIGYWKLNGSGSISNGATVFSDSIGSNDGVAEGSGLLSFVQSPLSEAVNFSGTGGANVTLPTSTLLPTTGYTLSAWVDPAVSSGELDIYYSGPTSGCNPSSRYFRLMSLVPSFFFGCGSSLNASVSVSLNTWSHLVWVVDSAKKATIYLNGTAVAGPTDNTGGQQIGTGNDVIGAAWAGGVLGSNSFNGAIDDVAVWNVALSSSEVQTLYSCQSGKIPGGC